MEKRKPLRLKKWDYSQAGAYFITICTQGKRQLLGKVVGADVLIGPCVAFSPYGRIVDNVLSKMPTVDKYVVMPNHIHVIFVIPHRQVMPGGPMGTSAPTVPGLVRYLKRSVTQEIKENLWQRSYYDHIIRDEADYLRIWKYIDTNPAKWREDCYYIP